MLPPAEVTVMLSLAFLPAFRELVPAFERESGHKVKGIREQSAEMMRKLKEGEVVDLVILSTPAIRELAGHGVVAKDGITELATCGVAVAVKRGGAKPDLSSADSFKRAMLSAESLVYSHGPSGVYLAKLFEGMGIAGELEGKTTRVKGQPAGELVAKGEAEIGLQQLSELLPIEGIDIVGPLPKEIQETTRFAVGLHARAPQRDAARQLVEFFTGRNAAAAMKKTGLEPLHG